MSKTVKDYLLVNFGHARARGKTHWLDTLTRVAVKRFMDQPNWVHRVGMSHLMGDMAMFRSLVPPTYDIEIVNPRLIIDPQDTRRGVLLVDLEIHKPDLEAAFEDPRNYPAFRMRSTEGPDGDLVEMIAFHWLPEEEPK